MILRYEDRRDSCSKTGVAGNEQQTERKKTSGFRKAAAVLLASTALIATLAACGDDAVQNPPTTQSDVGSKKDTGYEPKDAGRKDVQTEDVDDAGVPDGGPQDAGNDTGTEDDAGSPKNCSCSVDISDLKPVVRVDDVDVGSIYDAYKMVEDVAGKKLVLTEITTSGLSGSVDCQVVDEKCVVDAQLFITLYADGQTSIPQTLYSVEAQTVIAQLTGTAVCRVDYGGSQPTCVADTSGVSAVTSLGPEANVFVTNDNNVPTKEYAERKLHANVVGTAACIANPSGGTCAISDEKVQLEITVTESGQQPVTAVTNLGEGETYTLVGHTVSVLDISETVSSQTYTCAISEERAKLEMGNPGASATCVRTLGVGEAYICAGASQGTLQVKVTDITETVGPATLTCELDASGLSAILVDVNDKQRGSTVYSPKEVKVTPSLAGGMNCTTLCE
ncbi:MAG: hypothetical protein V1492_00660 [Candidatus Micrarchaeota archaeon]